MTQLLQIAAEARALSLDGAPPELFSRLRSQRRSLLAAAAGGRSFPGVGAALAVLGCGEEGSHPVLPGLRAPSLAAALEASALLSTAWGEDDVLLPARTGPVGWAAVLIGAELGRTWAEVDRAQAVGQELAARLAGCCLGARRPLRTPGLVLTFGVAAAAGLLLDLPEPKLANALSLALARAPSEGVGAARSGARLLGSSSAVALGWRCARLAERGVEGSLDALGPDLLDLLGGGRPLPGWWSGLGDAWLLLTCVTPRTPGSPFLAPALRALEQLGGDVLDAEGRRLQPSDILRIDVDVALPTAAMELQLGRAAEAPGLQGQSPDPTSMLHSVSRSLALGVALARSPGLEDLRPASLARSWPGARDLSRRVHLRHDWRMTLASWEALRARLPIDRLMEGVGPSALLGAALRVRGRGVGGADGVGAAGPRGGGVGMAWSELPLALAAERLGPRGAELSDELIEDPAAALGKGLEKIAGWASRRVERLLDAEGGTLARLGGRLGAPRRGSLDGASLLGMELPIPARVRVLEHGGRVWEGEVTTLQGLDDDALRRRCEERLGPAAAAAWFEPEGGPREALAAALDR